MSLASSCKLKLARFLILIKTQDRAECGKGTELHAGGHRTEKHILEGGPLHKKGIPEGGDIALTFLIRRTIGVGTLHNIDRAKVLK